MRQSVLLADTFAPAADHEGQFDFPVQHFGTGRQQNIVMGSGQARWGFHEHHRLVRNRHVRLLGVVMVVQADTDDLGGRGNGRREAIMVRHDRQGADIQGGDSCRPVMGEEIGVDVAEFR